MWTVMPRQAEAREKRAEGMQSECQIPPPTAICDRKSLLVRAPAAFFAISPRGRGTGKV